VRARNGDKKSGGRGGAELGEDPEEGEKRRPVPAIPIKDLARPGKLLGLGGWGGKGTSRTANQMAIWGGSPKKTD